MREMRKIMKMRMLLCAVFVLVLSSRTMPQSIEGSRATTWELIRKSQKKKSEPVKPVVIGRVLHFPRERSLGQLMIGDEDSYIKTTPFGYPFEQIRWERFGHARGDVKIPKGKIVRLILDSWTWQNPRTLSALKQLQPDDIYSLTLSPEWSRGGRSPDDNCMPYIAHLTELKTLNLDGANISTRGLEYLTVLKSLERLKPPADLSDSGIVQLGKLQSLKVLYICKNNSVTDKGLGQLSNLKSLVVLALSSVHMTDEGLKILSSLPSLNLLILDGNFTRDAAVYLKDVPFLKSLRIDMPQFDDRGMENISHLNQLENLSTHWVKNTTDRGIAYLKNMPNLKQLDVAHAKLTDKAMLDLKQIQTLEYLHLPNFGFTDECFKHVIELHNLKCLWGGSGSELTNESLQYISALKNLEELHIGGTGFDDEGMKHIAKLTKLKQLSIFTANQMTNDGLAELAGLESLTNLSIGGNTKVSISGLKSLNHLKNLKCLILKEIHQDNSILDISGLTKLERLSLSLQHKRKGGSVLYQSFQDADLACLADLTRLENLTLAGFGISDKGIRNISELNNLIYLTIICPGETRITDTSLQYLANMQKLYDLQIEDGHFTDEALDYLYNLPSLTRLELTSDYAFSNKAIRNFKRKNPNITRFQLMP